MINQSHIHKESQWEHFPWQKINVRVTLIQKKIYEASKQHNLQLLHKAQCVLLNSNEARLIAIEQIATQVSQYHKQYDFENYFIQDIEKFFLFKHLFKNNSLLKTKLKFLTEKVKEYLIYLCLEAEWKARIVPLINTHNQSIKWDIHLKNLSWNRIIHKNQTLSYIYSHILYWTRNKFCIHDPYNFINSVNHLFLTIQYTKKQWNKSILLKWQCQYMIIFKKYFKYGQQIFHFIMTDLSKYNISCSCYLINSILAQINYALDNSQLLIDLYIYQILSWLNIIDKSVEKLHIYIYLNNTHLKYFAIVNIINKVNILLLSLKKKKKYHSAIYLNFNNLNIYSILYKKLTSNCLYKYLFKINR